LRLLWRGCGTSDVRRREIWQPAGRRSARSQILVNPASLVTELASLIMPSFSPVATQLRESLRTFEASRQLSSSIYREMPPGRVESLDVPSGQCGTCPVGAVYEGYDPVTVKERRRWLVSR
jgi:hypothetical protein